MFINLNYSLSIIMHIIVICCLIFIFKIERQPNINNDIINIDLKSLKNFKTENISKENNFIDTNSKQDSVNQSFSENQFLQSSSFMELVPIDLDFDNSPRKDCSSIPIDEIDFPEIVYMIVDKKIELEIKLLKDYPEWHFLPEEDLQIKTIEIYFDLKVAKRDCKKDQKIIKVPNTNVFKLASKIMVARGIKRIISDKQLISL